MEFLEKFFKLGWFVLCFLVMVLGVTMVVTGLFPSTQEPVDRFLTPGVAWLRRELVHDFDVQQHEPTEAVGIYEGVDYQVLTYYEGIPDSDMAWATKFMLDESPYVVSVNGVWNGPLPPKGNRVKIDSPTGKIEDVVITDLDTGNVYVSDGSLSRPEDRLIITRYLDAETEALIVTCVALAPSRHMAEQGMHCVGFDGLMTISDVFDLNNGDTLIIEPYNEMPE